MFIIIPLSCQSLNGQAKKEYYKLWITPIDNSSKINGYLRDVGDRLIIRYNLSYYEGQSILINNIKEIKYRKNGKVSKGILLGVLSGFVIGNFIGNIGSTDKYPGENIGLIIGAGLTIPGAIIGGIIGSVKTEIPLNGNTKNKKEKLLKYKLPY